MVELEDGVCCEGQMRGGNVDVYCSSGDSLDEGWGGGWSVEI